MTVNERLVTAGLLDRFDAVVRRGDRAEMLVVLTFVALDKAQSAWTADTILADPTRYGHPKP